MPLLTLSVDDSAPLIIMTLVSSDALTTASPPAFTAAYMFGDNGLAPAETEEGAGYVDKKGQWVVKPTFEATGF